MADTPTDDARIVIGYIIEPGADLEGAYLARRLPAIRRPAIRRPAIRRPAIRQPAIRQPRRRRPARRQPAIRQPAERRPARRQMERTHHLAIQPRNHDRTKGRPMSDDDDHNPIEKVRKGVQSFADEMKAQGIHVGLGRDPVVCLLR